MKLSTKCNLLPYFEQRALHKFYVYLVIWGVHTLTIFLLVGEHHQDHCPRHLTHKEKNWTSFLSWISDNASHSAITWTMIIVIQVWSQCHMASSVVKEVCTSFTFTYFFVEVLPSGSMFLHVIHNETDFPHPFVGFQIMIKPIAKWWYEISFSQV